MARRDDFMSYVASSGGATLIDLTPTGALAAAASGPWVRLRGDRPGWVMARLESGSSGAFVFEVNNIQEDSSAKTIISSDSTAGGLLTSTGAGDGDVVYPGAVYGRIRNTGSTTITAILGYA